MRCPWEGHNAGVSHIPIDLGLSQSGTLSHYVSPSVMPEEVHSTSREGFWTVTVNANLSLRYLGLTVHFQETREFAEHVKGTMREQSASRDWGKVHRQRPQSLSHIVACRKATPLEHRDCRHKAPECDVGYLLGACFKQITSKNTFLR